MNEEWLLNVGIFGQCFLYQHKLKNRTANIPCGYQKISSYLQIIAERLRRYNARTLCLPETRR